MPSRDRKMESRGSAVLRPLHNRPLSVSEPFWEKGPEAFVWLSPALRHCRSFYWRQIRLCIPSFSVGQKGQTLCRAIACSIYKLDRSLQKSWGNRSGLDRQSLTTFCTTCIDDLATVFAFHARSKAMCTLARSVVWLIGPFNLSLLLRFSLIF